MKDQFDDPMDLEMQLLQSATHNDGEEKAATSTTTQSMHNFIRFIQSTIIFTDHLLSRVSSSKTQPVVDETNDDKREIISKIVREKNFQALEEFGDLNRVAAALSTDLINGVSNSEAINRSQPQVVSLCPTPSHRFSHHVFKSLKNKTILLLSLAAVLSLGFGIAEEGLQYGWYDGAFVLITIILLVLLPSIRK